MTVAEEMLAEIERLTDRMRDLRGTHYPKLVLKDRRDQYKRWLSHVQSLEQRAERAEAEVERLTRENKVLVLRTSGSLANNICPDHRDKLIGESCLKCQVETLVQWKDTLQARVRELEGGGSNG